MQSINGWTCLTFEGGYKVAYISYQYGTIDIAQQEGYLYYTAFDVDLPSGFFTSPPCHTIQCHAVGGYGLYVVTNGSQSIDYLKGWFFADMARKISPIVNIVCFGT